MKITRVWAMPNKNTFSIPPIRHLIQRYIDSAHHIIDPFVGDSPFKSVCCSNDLDESVTADYHEDAYDFLHMLPTDDADLVLFDPPYSPRQVSEVYRKMDRSVNMQTTQSSFWSTLKDEIARIIALNGHVITCGWNSGGIGMSRGFTTQEILLVPHGGWHNDTIVTVEQRA